MIDWLEGGSLSISEEPERASGDVVGDDGKELQLTLLGQELRERIDTENETRDHLENDKNKYQLQYQSTSSGSNEDDGEPSFLRFHGNRSDQQLQRQTFVRQQAEIDSMGGLSLLSNSSTVPLT